MTTSQCVSIPIHEVAKYTRIKLTGYCTETSASFDFLRKWKKSGALQTTTLFAMHSTFCLDPNASGKTHQSWLCRTPGRPRRGMLDVQQKTCRTRADGVFNVYPPDSEPGSFIHFFITFSPCCRRQPCVDQPYLLVGCLDPTGRSEHASLPPNFMENRRRLSSK